MRLVFYAAIISMFSFFQCEKEENENCFTDLAINKVSVSNTASVAEGIPFSVEAYGPDLCYSFSHFTIDKTGDKEYSIRVKATVPCGPAVCAQAIYYANPSGKISNVSAGTYVLKFFSNSTMFTSLTVTVN